MQTFNGFTQARLDGLAQKPSAAGIAISGPHGEASKEGFTVSWNFDPARQVLDLQCTKKPFVVTCEYVNGKMQELID